MPENDFKKVLMKPAVKAFIMTLFTTAISVLVGMLGTWDSNSPGFWVKLIGLIVVVALYVVILAWYTTAEVNKRRTLEVLERQVEAFTDLVINFISACETNAADINNCIHHVNDTHKIDPNIWDFKKASRALCAQIYFSICKLGKSRDYGVAYVALDEGADATDTVKMIAYANKNMHSPSVYGRPRHFLEAGKNADAYHDLKLFYKGSEGVDGATNNDIRWGVEEVKEVFRYSSQEAMMRSQEKYHAYIGIPVFCDNRKMVGLLEVVAMDETKFGCLTKKELEEVADKLLVPYANLFLLIHKMEKALFAGVNR